MNLSHKKRVAAIVGIIALAIPAVASAAGESANVKLPTGYLKINPATCKFIHPEQDVAVRSWVDLRMYTLREDARHDVKEACLTNRKPPKATLLYKSVYATGTGQTVTAQCPAGYYVTGGGSHQEVKGSYPVGNDGWQVVRDPQSPPVLSATAICIQVTS